MCRLFNIQERNKVATFLYNYCSQSYCRVGYVCNIVRQVPRESSEFFCDNQNKRTLTRQRSRRQFHPDEDENFI